MSWDGKQHSADLPCSVQRRQSLDGYLQPDVSCQAGAQAVSMRTGWAYSCQDRLKVAFSPHCNAFLLQAVGLGEATRETRSESGTGSFLDIVTCPAQVGCSLLKHMHVMAWRAGRCPSDDTAISNPQARTCSAPLLLKDDKNAVRLLTVACPCLNLAAMLAWQGSLHALPNGKQHAPTPHAKQATHAQTL